MRTSLLSGTSALIALSALFISSPAVAAPPSGKFVLGYVDGSFASGQTNAAAFATNMTAITIGSTYWVDNTGTVGTASGQPITPATIISTGHSNGLLVYPDISNCDASGTWNDSYAKGAAVTNQAAAVKNIVSFVQANNFDGCTIDFEYDTNGFTSADPTPTQFDSFVTALATALHNAKATYKLIIAVVPHNNWTAAAYDYAGIAKAADYMFMMTYNECGPGWGTTGFNNNEWPGPTDGSDWITSEITYQLSTENVVPAKLLLGLPAYGADYCTTDSSSSFYNGGAPFWANYGKILALHSGATLSRGYAADTVSPWASWGSFAYTSDTSSSSPTEPVLWYDDATSLQAKAALAATYNLGGAGVYAVGYEDQTFWTAFNAGLGGSTASYTITASAGTGGTISPSGTTTVASGGSQTFTITPSSGYSIASVTVNGAHEGAVSTYTFSNVTANATISAAFSANTVTTYTITATASAGGTISPSGTSTVAAGGNQTYTITPNSGYTISSVSVDGTSVGVVSTYAFTGVGQNHTISATFAATTSGNLAPSGSGYTWSKLTSATSNSNEVAAPGINDGNLTTGVNCNSKGEGGKVLYEAAGVLWSGTHTITSVDFINGTITSGGDGYLQSNLSLQFTTNGTTWTASGWTVSPGYPYSNAAGTKTYTFTGAAASGIKGVRVVGAVGNQSWEWIVNEVQIFGQ